MNTLEQIDKKKQGIEFYKIMFGIALPMIVQGLIGSSLNMIDTVMISSLGSSAVAAVGVANQLWMVFIFTCFGLYSGAGVFISQYFGVGDIKSIRKTLGLEIHLGIIVSLLFMSVAIFFPSEFIGIFSNDPEVLDFGVKYIKIIGWSYILVAIGYCFAYSCRGIRQTKVAMKATIIALFTNTFLNYVLIFGKLGFPELGVEGAAYATLIARLVELIVILYIIYSDKNHILAAKLKELRAFDFDFVKMYFKKAIPVLVTEMSFSLAGLAYSVAFSSVGTDAFAAVQISSTVANLFMCVNFGVANASAVMLGNELGASNFNIAKEYAKKFTIISLVSGAALGILMYLGIPLFSLMFNAESNIVDDLSKLLILRAVIMPIIMLNSVLIIGILRSGGDTTFCMWVEGISCWGIGVPLAFLLAKTGSPIEIIILATGAEFVVKLIGLSYRAAKGKWVRNIIGT